MQASPLQKLVVAWRRRWRPAALVWGAVMLSTGVVSLLQKPVYQATAAVLFKKDSSSQPLGLNEGAGQLTTLGKSNPLDTQILVLQSVPLVQKVIDAEHLVNSNGHPLTVPQFLGHLQVQIVKGTDILQISYLDTDRQRAEAALGTLIRFYCESDVAANRSEVTAARTFIENQLPKVEATLRARELALRNFRQQHYIVDLQEEAHTAVGFLNGIDGDMAQVQADLQNMTTRVGALQRSVGMNAADALALTALSQSPAVQGVLAQLQEVQGQLAVQRSRYQDENPSVVNLKNKETALRTLLTERMRQVLGKAPGIGAKATAQQTGRRQPPPANSATANSEAGIQIGPLKQMLIEQLVTTEVERLGLSSRLQALRSVRAASLRRINAIPRLIQEEQALMRQLKATQATYEVLSQRLQEVRVTENENIGNTRLLNPTHASPNPVSPNLGFNLAVSGSLGLLLATLVALVVETADRSLKTVREVREQFGYPLLGTIPLLPKSELLWPSLALPAPAGATRKMLQAAQSASTMSQIFRMIQASLRFVGDEPRVILISSCLSEEGKSTVAANLAHALAQLNRKVVLLDADLYRPSQQQIWQQSGSPGVSELLRGDITLDRLVQPVDENLDVLFAGSVPANPLALIDSGAMGALIAQLREAYEYVIIDTPPLLETADAMTLSKWSDGSILVLCLGKIDAAAVSAGYALLEQSGQRILGQIINRVNWANEPGSAYGRTFYYAGAVS